jgi:hypothetical protein
VLLVAGFAGRADAATLTVTNNSNTGAGSLRNTVAAAAAGDTINFSATVQAQTITLTSPITPAVTPLTIQGNGGPTLTGNTTLLTITAGRTLQLNELRIVGANAPDAATTTGFEGGDGGGNVVENSGTLRIADSLLANNTGGDGGSAGVGGASEGGGGGGGAVLASTGTLNIQRSTISGNVAGGGGSGPGRCGGGGGGGAVIASTGGLTIRDSTISANTGGNGGSTNGAGRGGGGATIASTGTTTLTNSTMSANTAGSAGGAHLASVACAGSGGGGGFGAGGGGGTDTGDGGGGAAGGSGFFGDGGDAALIGGGAGGGGGGGADGTSGSGAGGGAGGGASGGPGGTGARGGGGGGTGGGGGGHSDGNGGSGGSGGGGGGGLNAGGAGGVGGGAGDVGAGGGSGNGAVAVYGGSMTINNSTLAANIASVGGQPGGNGSAGVSGGGAVVRFVGGVNVTSSILADTTGGLNQCRGVIAGSNSLVEVPQGCTVPADTLSDDPQLAPLGDYGGPTFTMRPAPTTPVFDKGSDPLSLLSDQRGVGFPRTLGSAPDIGAVEARAGHIKITKVCAPVNDGGLFNLRIDNDIVAPGDAPCGATREIGVSLGLHTVSETAGSGTQFANYTRTIGGDCAANGQVTIAAGDTKTCTITNVRNPDLSMSLRGTPNPLTLGSQLTYQLRMRNAGPANATGVTGVLTLAQSETFLSATSACIHTATRIVTCTIPRAIAPGTGATPSVTVSVGQTGVVEASAIVSSSLTDPLPADNTSTERTRVLPLP